MLFNPDADYTFALGDIMILMGHTKDIMLFRQHFHCETPERS